MMRTLMLLSMALGVLLTNPAARADDALPPGLREVSIDQRLDQQLPLDLHFRDEQGKDVVLGSYFGERPVVLALAYYECPMLCTLVLNGLVSSLRGMNLEPGKDFDILTVSFDAREKPELAAAKKKTYLENYRREGAAEAWHFLTGEQPAIDRLTEAVGFRYKFQQDTGQFAHAAAIMVLTPGGRLARYLYGVEYAPRDLRLALVEAGRGKIGTAVDQLLLFCYQYDASMGRYTPMVFGVVRVAGLLTVLALATFILVMRRRERHALPHGALRTVAHGRQP